MTFDIDPILKDWPYEHGQVSARRIKGLDGRDKIQLRLDMGILQMEVDGRPDARRPHGFASLLDYHEDRLQRHVQAGGSQDDFKLDEQACEQLRAEGIMYYHRYLAQFVLEDYEAVQRDTVRNLRLMDFCQEYAAEESDRFALEQYRPYVLMMHARARGRIALGMGKPRVALAAIREGVGQIRQFYRRFQQESLAGRSGEISVLRAMAREIQAQIPVDPMLKMRKALARAVAEERYEQAAELRDRLERLAHRRR